MLACVDGGALCVPALVAAGVALAGWLGWATTSAAEADCEEHCDHCPGEHEPAD